MNKASSFFGLLGINLLFVVAFAAAVGVLSLRRRAAFAVLKRNFLAYFTSPIGYVFLCMFVWLTAGAAFWSEDFFNSNLANLDQLNRYLPLILLVFIPAITMSIWADERRQGTDELLLTIPAGDGDIVMGKFLAAVSIYTVSLLFSEICNVLVLMLLGNPDMGLLLGNYLGYWLAGVAMLSIGMVASFLTSNLTVGFVLGVLLNVPLVAAGYADVVLGPQIGRAVSRWSIAEQFTDFQGGVISLASVLFFLMVTGVMIYISLVLIGRRHWSGGRDGHSMGGHYLVRSLALILFFGSACVLLTRWDPVRADVTSEGLNSLNPDTLRLLQNLKPKFPIHVDAFVSRDLPEEFIEKRIDLANVLREINSLGAGKITAQLHEVELFSAEAARAKSEYGIDSREVFTEVRGAATRKNIIFGFGVRSGLQRISVPFLGQGARIEYELIRSIVTVNEPKRKRVGVLLTDATLFGGAGLGEDSENEEDNQDQPLIQELRRQYQVVKVDPSRPITARYDVLLAVQPSSLGREPMKNFIAAVRSGQPTAIFEDPLPFLDERVPGTLAPKRPMGGMQFMMQPPEAKGDIQPLWDLLGIKLGATLRKPPQEDLLEDPEEASQGRPVLDADVVWQDYNPHEADRDKLEMSHEWVFITPEPGAESPFSIKSPMVSGLQEVLLLYPGLIRDVGGNRTYTELIRTNRVSGTVGTIDLIARDRFGRQNLVPRNVVEKLEQTSDQPSILAVQLTRAPEPGAEDTAADKSGNKDSKTAGAGQSKEEKKRAEEKSEKDPGFNVVVVADIDVLNGAFFYLRTMGADPRNPIRNWNLDNVPLVLNVIDHLAGEDRFLNIRKRRPHHRELSTVQSISEEAKKDRREAREQAEAELDKQKAQEKKLFTDRIKELNSRPGLDERTAAQELMTAMKDGNQRIQRKNAELNQQRDAEYRDIDLKLAEKIQDVQDRYKLWAVLLPPILPLLIALCVFLVRRSHESEGEAAERMV